MTNEEIAQEAAIGFNEAMRQNHINAHKPKAAPRGEQEWTIEPCVGAISGQEWPGLSCVRSGSHIMGSMNTSVAKSICDAHEAALAAERDVAKFWKSQVEILRQQLLSAQAAIEKVEHENIVGNIAPEVIAKRDATLVKPLVDALERCVSAIGDLEGTEVEYPRAVALAAAASVGRYALANVKEL
jgi:hypothetical protein